MFDELDQIKKSAQAFTDLVNDKASDVDEIVLVTFNDPDASYKITTSTEEEFITALDSIELHGGNDCPEMALSGIKLGLEHSKPGSHLFVFTDASAKDYDKFDEIKSLCQKKESKITFILTGNCGSTSSEGYLVYQKIADACYGETHRTQKNEFSQLFTQMHASGKGIWAEPEQNKSESGPADV